MERDWISDLETLQRALKTFDIPYRNPAEPLDQLVGIKPRSPKSDLNDPCMAPGPMTAGCRP